VSGTCIRNYSQAEHGACAHKVGGAPVHAIHTTPGRGVVRMSGDVVPSR
jgi:hypothetical protein